MDIKLSHVDVKELVEKIGNDDDFVVMVLYNGGSLAMWRMEGEKWIDENDAREGSHYDNIAYHNGKFFAMDVNGLALTIDSVSLEMTEIASVKNHSGLDDSDKTQILGKVL